MSENQIESEQPKVEENIEEVEKAKKVPKAKGTASQGKDTMKKDSRS